ncbi:hypothetical protein PAMP_010722 [Pampus punctatissimus]
MDESPAPEDQRLDFIADYVLRTLKLKHDRWQKCVSSEDNRKVLQEFLDRPEQRTLVVSVTAGGLLQPAADFTAGSKNKAVYFVKQRQTALSPDSMKDNLVCGDLSYAPLDQFSALVEEVVVPLLSNSKNHTEWPQVVSQDLRRHVHSLKTHVFVVSGQVQGKTLLPLPAGSEKVEQVALETDKRGETVDKSIIHSLESAVIEWSHQICAVLKKDSSEALLEGKNPTPHTELLFWKNRYADLEYIYSQLKSSKVKKMEMLLEAVESSYSPAFSNILQDVLAALEEAKDICTYLKPLQRLFEDMESAEFSDVRGQIGPLMHIVCLVWANSRYYNTPARLIVLLQETCNLLIQQARVYVVPEEVLRGEVSESLLKVQTSLEILQLLRSTYEDRKANLVQYQRNGSLDILLTAVDLLKLEKLEIGGVRGRALSQQVQLLHQEFVDTYKSFTEKPYDCLDLSNMEFEEDVREFKLKVDDTDRRLGAVFCQAFDEASGLEHAFKVLDMFGGLLERPLVAEDALARYPLLLSMFDRELDCCKLLYNKHIQIAEELGSPPVNKNMPAVAGGLRWAQELQQRIQGPFSKFRHLSYPCLESTEGARVIQKYEEMMQLLDRYSTGLYETWTETVGDSSQYNLSLPLISRDPASRLISVNFNPQLASVLREVKYLEARQTEAIPDTAVQLYTTRGQLWQYVANLELTVGRYNKVMHSVIDVEHPLVQGQLRDIDTQLQKAEESLNWNSQGIWEYIQEVRDSVCDLESRLQRTKDNVEEIQSCMRSWACPMFDRKEGKKDTLLSLEDRAERLDRFYTLIRSSGEKIHFLLKSNRELFRAEPSSEEWKAYVEHVDDMIIDGFFTCIECSLKFFLDNTDQRVVAAPLFEAQLDLKVPDMVFAPPLEFGAGDSFFELVESLINDVFRISSLVPRLAQHSPFPHYQADMEDMADLADMRHLLMDRVQGVMATCCEFRNSLECYSYLYVDDRKEFMRQFLLYGHVLTSQEMEVYADDGVPESPPTLDNFREQVDGYEKIYEEVQGLEPVRVFHGWMRVDGRSMKSALLSVIKKWSFMFKQHLIDHVTNSLSDLDKFVSVAEAGLGQRVEEGDYGGLVGVMGHLLAVKERQNTTDAMFEPLQQTITLLKVYEQELPDVVYKQLEELPEKWTNVKKQAVLVKQQVAPLQAIEVASLRRKCASFDVEQHTFREHFRNNGPFRFDSEKPCQMLDAFHQQIQEREAVMASLVESASLFEVTVSEYKQLRQCRREVGLLKELWDMITVVESSMAAWKMTPWREIHVEDMELECKRFSKDIRGLDKEVRAWEAFTGLDSRVKNLLISLRAVAELQNPAIRARHWHQLMAATGVRFTMDQLNLHCFEEEVRGIVDKAVKEMGMEKVLSELNSTWTGMQFQYEPHHRTQVPLLRSDEELIETLEDNQVQLQNLMSSKYIAHFLDEVSSWQSKLSVADSVISIWFEDSRRFEGIDADFKELANAAHQTPNVVEATNKPGLFGKLEDIQSRLSLCEKALAEYLDTKRLAFPRFYFISSADLLDILSNGTNPHQVQKHLSKLFDNMAKMQFEADGEGNPSKTGLGMYSKEEEYVPFNQSCDCTGQFVFKGLSLCKVEVWLNRVLDSMRSTVRHEMTEAVTAYEDKPREQWLFDYPAQVALTCTQIWWTSDVGMAFARLEEGYDNAMKEYYKKQVSQLNTLISMLVGQLSPGDRQKVMTICTIDVHARDVVAKMIAQKVENSQAFVWLSQLRHRWDEKDKHCFANICDAQFLYSYEYLGNTPRLVITPLTDRCYITLTQSLHLTMSGAPAGPAGTGKTETTKDLGRALGIMVYVFNCSEQMDYKSCGNIYKGLAQTGAWGCFDEFNRISVEVLSVVAVQDTIFMHMQCRRMYTVDKNADYDHDDDNSDRAPQRLLAEAMDHYSLLDITISSLPFLLSLTAMKVKQPPRWRTSSTLNKAEANRRRADVKSIQDAIRDKKQRFNFMGEEVNLCPSVGIFITMNPGYAGRTELPENLKALFRPCAMVVPDFELICEIMLVAEGFISARVLARKFITLYTLCKELLSKQDHYDWGLRAIKSVLVVAGSLKRGDPSRAEDQVLMRALRDFNIPKIVTDDMPVFMGLIGDLFPALDVPRKRDLDFEKQVKESILDLKLQAEDNFVLKCETAAEINKEEEKQRNGERERTAERSITTIYPLSLNFYCLCLCGQPFDFRQRGGSGEVVQLEELLAVRHSVFVIGNAGTGKSQVMRSLQRTYQNMKRRPVWADLNPKAVTNDELFGIINPATREWKDGILYINPADLGWNPPVSSWIDRREVQSEKANLTILFDKYLPSCLDALRSRFKKIIPVPEQSMVQMLCYLLECLLTPENTPPDCAKELYELYFVFAAVWAFGGAMFQDQLVDYRVEFSKWWVAEFKTIKFPSQGTVFDYYIDPESKKFEPWSKMVPKFVMDADTPLQACLVHTTETIRVRYFMDRLLEHRRPVMLVGNAGTGKSVLVGDKLGSLDAEKYMIKNVPFNYYTTSAMLQAVLEKPLEKKAGRNYGPPGNRRLIYFIDDMNMPERHFSVFALSFPGAEALSTIYTSILSQHLSGEGFNATLQKSCPTLVQLALALHQRITSTFLPTAVKFHYIFNLRDLSNIFQGILFCTGECLKAPLDLLKIYLHESNRVYRDKLVEEQDFQLFDKLQADTVKKFYEDMEETLVQTREMNLYCHFARGLGEARYMAAESWSSLSKTLLEVLDSYNEVNATLNLVLFEDAMAHICRINRILESPRGNALLVGVGGSGKQSLTRLAAFISSLEVFQITLRKGYGITDLKGDLASLYVKAGVKNIGTVLLMTDAQVADEKFLVLVNDLLASALIWIVLFIQGEIPDLFQDDEVENIIGSVRPEVRASGLMDTRENCWKFFIDRVRRQLKPQVKESVSKFMAYVHMSVNQTSKEYLANERRYNYTTPKSFLEQIKLYRSLLGQKSKDLTTKMERLENGLQKLNSTSTQCNILMESDGNAEPYLSGSYEDFVTALISLYDRPWSVHLCVVGIETEKVSKEKAVADEEEQKVAAIAVVVSGKQRDCEEDLAKAEPALLAAQDALNTLNKNNLTELKSFGSPVAAVTNVTAAVMVLMAPGGKVPKDRSWKAAKVMMAKVDAFLDSLINFNKENIPEACLKAIQPYLQASVSISSDSLESILTARSDPEFQPDLVASKSYAAAGLCSWVLNIVKFYEVYCEVEPKRQALSKANAELAAAQEKLAAIKSKINVGGLASENVRWAEAVENFRKQERTLCGDVLLITAFISYLGYFTKRYRLQLMDNTWRPYLSQLKSYCWNWQTSDILNGFIYKVPIPVTPDLDPLTMLMDDADIAAWQNEGLPADRMSTENATILTSCQRWPLMVDPQLQGIKWIKNKYGENLRVIRIGQRGQTLEEKSLLLVFQRYLDAIERALAEGDVVLIENLEETLDPVLGPLLGRETIKKGRYIKIGDKECEYNPSFRLILHTKLASPHYQPELQAQCTLINFTVTRDGLEDQLLAAVVSMERPDLEQLKSDLTKQQNGFKITLKTLEDNLLSRLSSASGNFLGDTELVENLETTKRTAAEIEEKVKEAKVTEAKINEAREHYRPAAARASLLYFIMNDLNKIHPMYQFSLKAFSVVFQKAVLKAEPDEALKQRVSNLIDSITSSVFQYTTRGLFECDKLTYIAQLAFQILLMNKEINPAELDFLLRYPVQPGVTSPVDFLSNHSWGGIKSLCSMEEFRNLDRDIEGSAKRWKKFAESECPEKEKFPQEWKNKTSLQRLCMMRALRPDRMTYAVRDFVEEKLGSKYVIGRSLDFAISFEESGPATPMFFILSPGVDPLKDVEKHGKKLGYTFDNKNFHNVSLGQGQEVVAEQALDLAAENGHWVILQNIHLVARWLGTLEKLLEQHAEGSHENFRVFVSAEPSSTPEGHIIPQGILENSIKITNEPPTGMHANLHKALDNFNQLPICRNVASSRREETPFTHPGIAGNVAKTNVKKPARRRQYYDTLEMCARENEFKSILFALCYFHAVVAERRKFGPQGWNRSYPFNTGDLTISINVLYNYLEANLKVPYDDLRYLFGEIMYGGHITDDWDRRLCRTYLEEFIKAEMMEGELCLAPGFPLPGNMDYNSYHQYIDDTLPAESPYLYGLHPNAEIGFLTQTSEKLFRTVLEMQPRDGGVGEGGGSTREEKVRAVLEEIMEKLPEEFNMAELLGKAEERTPYQVVALQECERMNHLTQEIRRSLRELSLGLKGELTMTSDMENLQNAIFLDLVPDSWTKRAYPSMSGLALWFTDLLARIKELEAWSSDFVLPSAVWLAGFFNPQSFLTAIMQAMARRNEWPLDSMSLQCDVTKKNREDFSSPPREGAYVHGLYMEGARWDTQTGLIVDARLKELTPTMPVIFIRAIPVDKQENRNVYQCPVYKTRQRGPTYVWTFNLKTKEKSSKWTLAGVALLLQI